MQRDKREITYPVPTDTKIAVAQLDCLLCGYHQVVLRPVIDLQAKASTKSERTNVSEKCHRLLNLFQLGFDATQQTLSD